MKRAAIVSPIRTPVGKFLGSLASIPAGELAAAIIKSLVERTAIDPERIDDVVFAQGYGNGEAPCIARWAALAAGLPISVPGYQLDRRRGGGLQDPRQPPARAAPARRPIRPGDNVYRGRAGDRRGLRESMTRRR